MDKLISKASERRKRLIRTYKDSDQFGLVLGAGVTVTSNVPSYNELALRLLEKTAKLPQFKGSRKWASDLVEFQRNQLAKKLSEIKSDELISFVRRQLENDQHAYKLLGNSRVPPDEIILYVRRQFKNDERSFRRLVKKELYKDVNVGATVSRKVFEVNSTLDSILRLCAARPGSILSPGKSKYKVETNNKIGGILTTNYDNLVEGAFHTKYRRKLLNPVGRPSTDEVKAKYGRTIPVFHIHGYVGYKANEKDKDLKNSDIVVAEGDYFKVFYDPLGFGNYIAMSFLRRFPILFIGSRMTDKNLRRFLYHLHTREEEIPKYQKKYAILKIQDSPVDAFMDEILLTYGVETIWVKEFEEIKKILRDMYVNSGKEDTTKTLSDDWKNLPQDAWKKSR